MASRPQTASVESYHEDSTDQTDGQSRQPRRQSTQSSEDSALSQARHDNAAVNHAAPNNTVSPDLINELTARITAQVVEQLKQQNLDTVAATNSEPQSAEFTHTDLSRKSSSSPSPPQTARQVYTPPSPIHRPTRPDSPPQSPTLTQSPSRDNPGGRVMHHRSQTEHLARDNRPVNAERTYSNLELSTIDQKWGRLFDADNKPTPRLGQFLRGLANHIIDEFHPKKSIVVTPEKMAAFYGAHPMDREIHQMISIFKTQANEFISHMYQYLGCQHHLIQDDSHKAPKVPGLTAAGFAQWMTISILAYPEHEAVRLGKIVQGMPIDADGMVIDGKPERLPKQISRHLLPSKEDKHYRQLMEEAISDFLDDVGFSGRRKSNTSPPISKEAANTQSNTHPIDIPPPRSSSKPIERERMPYSGVPSASEPSSITENVQMERERQPYTIHPGHSNVHSDAGLNVPERNRGRANSVNAAPREPEPVSNSRRRSNANTQPYMPQPRSGGQRRAASPPLHKYGGRSPYHSDPAVSYIPPTFSPPVPTFSPSSYSPSGAPPPLEPRDRNLRDRDEDRRYLPSHASSSSSMQYPPPPEPRDRDPRDRDEDRRYLPTHTSSSSLSGMPHQPPHPPSTDHRDREDETRRHQRESKRVVIDDPRMSGEINHPRDAERWDRIQDSKGIDPRNSGNYEDYYKGSTRGGGGGYDPSQYVSRH